MSQTGPQYHRGGQGRNDEAFSGGAASPVTGGMVPGVTPDVGFPPSGAQSTQDYGRSEFLDRTENYPVSTASNRASRGETYGYDYRYSDGMDDSYIRANPTGWFAFVLAIVGAALAWDRLGAVFALAVLLIAFICSLIALSLSGRRKWYSWIAVVLSTVAGGFALFSVLASLVGLMGGFHFFGHADLWGVVTVTRVDIPKLTDIGMSFPDSGLSAVVIR